MNQIYLRHFARISSCSALLLSVFGTGVFEAHGAAKVSAYKSQIDLPTYPWAAVKHPYFRGTDKVNIYPYPMLDFLSREKTNRTYRTVVLENEYLRITFLPELGGKIYEVIDKTVGKPMFYVNHVVKPGLIGQCGAWTSGGVEWNTGPQGHTVSCMQPVPVVILPPEKDGSQSVAVGETERIYGTRWTVVVTVRPGRSFIEERIRIYNPTEYIRPYYFWNCTAAPNTPGFRFIYPMTLGCDHAGEKFFQWPIDHGKDLTRGTNYQDASSIFAWHCDQDFFGSYNDDLDHGVVSYANHHELPGKKAWTWGQGGFGKMHQMDLTDDDGPYNEVQTGPLLTQAQVGRLDPCQAVEWKEWWYPVHGIGGFTFANKDVAVNATRKGASVKIALLGTAERKSAEVCLSVDAGAREVGARKDCTISAAKAAELELAVPESAARSERIAVQIRSGADPLAWFWLPLDLPARIAPEKKAAPQTASELTESGWQDILFAKFSEAKAQFIKALDQDPKSGTAKTGLAFLRLDTDPKEATLDARSAVHMSPSSGLAHYVSAVVKEKTGNLSDAIAEAWESSLDPVTAAAGRAFVAKLQIRIEDYRQAVAALDESGPWQADPLCRNRLAFASLKLGDKTRAVRLAKENLSTDPLDVFARSILWLANAESGNEPLRQFFQADQHALGELVGEFSDLVGDAWQPINQLLKEFCPRASTINDPITSIWAAHAGVRRNNPGAPDKARQSIAKGFFAGAFPYQREMLPVLRKSIESDPKNAEAALYLGHLLFHLGRYAEGREQWKRAAELGAEPVVAYRALGMAAKTLDGDLKAAREWLEKAHTADPTDAIVARDLANVLFALAEKCESASEKTELISQARDRLRTAFQQGKGRSDFVALLARAQNRLGEYAESARMMDSVRVTVWEGAHEVHDLFEEAHLALGDAALKSSHPNEALAEFNRALEYPANLATGKLENALEAHIHFRRGNALAALDRKPEAIAAWKLAADAPESSDGRITEARQKAKEALQSTPP